MDSKSQPVFLTQNGLFENHDSNPPTKKKIGVSPLKKDGCKKKPFLFWSAILAYFQRPKSVSFMECIWKKNSNFDHFYPRISPPEPCRPVQFWEGGWRGLLMEEILHHPTCMKPCIYWDIYYINWLYSRISEPSTGSPIFGWFAKFLSILKSWHPFWDG